MWTSADDAEVLALIKPFIVDVVQVSSTAVISPSFTPPVLTSLNAVPPTSTSTSSSSSSSSSTPARAERRVWTVPSLDVFFYGAATAEGGAGQSATAGMGLSS